jgi:hypothetical protein
VFKNHLDRPLIFNELDPFNMIPSPITLLFTLAAAGTALARHDTGAIVRFRIEGLSLHFNLCYKIKYINLQVPPRLGMKAQSTQTEPKLPLLLVARTSATAQMARPIHLRGLLPQEL